MQVDKMCDQINARINAVKRVCSSNNLTVHLSYAVFKKLYRAGVIASTGRGGATFLEYPVIVERSFFRDYDVRVDGRVVDTDTVWKAERVMWSDGEPITFFSSFAPVPSSFGRWFENLEGENGQG